MKKSKIPAAPDLPLLEAADFYLEDEEIFSGFTFTGDDQSYQTAENMALQGCMLKNIHLQNTHLPRFDCTNVIFENCDLSNVVWIGASFWRVIFRGCKLTGANFAESHLRDCVFEDCLADFSSFSNATLKVVTFDHCQLNEAEFFEMNWQHTRLTNSQLTGSNWFHVKLKGLDFSTNIFDRIALSQENLPGLIVNQEQALVIAMGLGIVISD